MCTIHFFNNSNGKQTLQYEDLCNMQTTLHLICTLLVTSQSSDCVTNRVLFHVDD
jgi:hypothetical protein